MAGTVKVFGHQVKTQYVVIGLVILTAGGIWEWRRRQQAQAAAASPAGTAAALPAAGAGNDPYPPDGTTGNPSDPNSTDPATGATYGDEQLGGGYAGFAGSGGPAGGPGGFGGFGFTGDGGGTGGQNAFTSNGQWAQAAEQYLVSQAGANAETVSAALGKYITGQAVTPAQQTIIEQAIAYEGYPPVAGSSGFPPSIHLASSSGGGGTGATVPKVAGLTYAQASAVLDSAGFKAQKAHPTYRDPVTAQNPAGGAHAKAGTVIRLTGTPGRPPPGRKVKVPDVIGRQYQAAAAELAKDGLRARRHPGQAHVNVVTSQAPAPGTEVARGATVTLSGEAVK